MKKITFLSILFLLFSYAGLAQTKDSKELSNESPVPIVTWQNKIGDDTLALAEDGLEKNVSLYPNPVKDKLYLKMSNRIQVKSVSLYNMLGKATTTNLAADRSIDTSNLASGVYVLRLVTNRGTLTKKVVKN